MSESEREYTYQEAHDATGIPVSTLRYWAAQGKLEVRRVHPRRVAIRASELARVKALAPATAGPRDARIAELERRIIALEAQLALNRPRSALYGPTDGLAASQVQTHVPRAPNPAAASVARRETSSEREPLPVGWIPVSRWCKGHSRDQKHPIQQRSIGRQVEAGHLTWMEAPTDRPWILIGDKTNIDYKPTIAFTPEQHIAACLYAAGKWPELFVPSCGPDCPYSGREPVGS